MAWTIELYRTKYIIGVIFSSGGATLYKDPSDQTVLGIFLCVFESYTYTGGVCIYKKSYRSGMCKEMGSLEGQCKFFPGAEIRCCWWIVEVVYNRVYFLANFYTSHEKMPRLQVHRCIINFYPWHFELRSTKEFFFI